MEDPVGLSRVQVPDKLAVLERGGGRHHAINPFWVVEGGVDIWALIVPLTIHIEVVGALHGNGADTTDLFGPNGTS